jgi:hypothetical protein
MKPDPALRSDWLTPILLVLLSAIPVLAGIAHLASLAQHAPVTAENARFVASPLPFGIHIVSVTVYCFLGAFQFSDGLRRRHPLWHRRAGWLSLPCGILAALTGLWMTAFYPLPAPLQGPLLFWFRLFIGSSMVACLILAAAAILRRRIPRHRAWMIRGYAIGQGAGTQALLLGPLTLLAGPPAGLLRDVLMVTAWLINLAIAEKIIRSRAARIA